MKLVWLLVGLVTCSSIASNMSLPDQWDELTPSSKQSRIEEFLKEAIKYDSELDVHFFLSQPECAQLDIKALYESQTCHYCGPSTRLKFEEYIEIKIKFLKCCASGKSCSGFKEILDSPYFKESYFYTGWRVALNIWSVWTIEHMIASKWVHLLTDEMVIKGIVMACKSRSPSVIDPLMSLLKDKGKLKGLPLLDYTLESKESGGYDVFWKLLSSPFIKVNGNSLLKKTFLMGKRTAEFTGLLAHPDVDSEVLGPLLAEKYTSYIIERVKSTVLSMGPYLRAAKEGNLIAFSDPGWHSGFSTEADTILFIAACCHGHLEIASIPALRDRRGFHEHYFVLPLCFNHAHIAEMIWETSEKAKIKCSTPSWLDNMVRKANEWHADRSLAFLLDRIQEVFPDCKLPQIEDEENINGQVDKFVVYVEEKCKEYPNITKLLIHYASMKLWEHHMATKLLLPDVYQNIILYLGANYTGADL